MKNMNRLGKKGDISAATLVSIILLVIGFGIVLMFIVRIYYSESVDTSACKESVTLRGLSSAGSPFGAAESLVNLRCKTQKICITSKMFGGDCTENFGNERVSNKKVKTENQVAKVIADEVLNCWDMTGQGRLSLFSPGWAANFGVTSKQASEETTGTVYSSCIICSRIAFGVNSLKSQGIDLGKVDVYEYMMKYKAPGEELSYAQLIAAASPAGVSLTDKDKMANLSSKFEEEMKRQGLIPEEIKELPTLKSSEMAVVFMQIRVPKYSTVLLNTFGTAMAANFASGGLAGKIASYTIQGISSIPVVGKLVVGLGMVAVAGVQGYNTYKNVQTAAGHCGDVKFNKEESYGCSAVRVIDYNADNLKVYCDTIESIS